MAGTPIEILIKFMADARQARAETLGLSKAQDQLAASTAKANAAGKSGGGNTKTATDHLNKNTDAANKNTKSYKANLDTTAQLMNQHKLLASAWKDGSNIVDKQYLSSIKGLQRGMARFNQEAKKTILYNKQISTTLDDSSQSFLRFMMKGNLTVRTLENMSTKLINVGKNAQWTGRQMMVGITAPVVAIGAMSVQSALEVGKLDLALKKLLQVNDGGGNIGGTLKALDDQSKSVATTLGTTRLEVKDMQGEFASMGFDGGFIKELTQVTTEFQKLGNIDPAAATDMVRVLAQRNGAKGMSEAANIADVRNTISKLNLIENKTALNMKDVATNFSDIFPIFDQFKTSAPQVIALLSGFKQQGVDVSEGANTLKLALTKLGPAMAHLGDGSADNGARLKALKQALEDVNAATGMKFSLFDDKGEMRTGLDLLSQVGVAYAELQKRGGKMAGTIKVDLMRSLFGVERSNEGYAFLDALSKSLDVQTAAGQDLAKAMQIADSSGSEATATWMKQLQQYKDDPTVQMANKIEKLKISFQELGAKLMPVALKIMGVIGKIVDAFTNLPERTQNIILGLVGAMAALGPIIYIASQSLLVLGTAFKGLLLPAKLFFSMLKIEPKEMLMGNERMVDSMTDLRNSFDADGDVKKYVTGMNNLMDSTKRASNVTDSLSAAKEAQIFQTNAATTAITGEAAAQSRLNAIRQAGVRGSIARIPGLVAGAGLSRTGTNNLPALLDNMMPEVSREAVVGRSDTELASELKQRIDARHAKENEKAQARRLMELMEGDNLTVRRDVVPSAKSNSTKRHKTAAKRLQKQIDAMGTPKQISDEANRIAAGRVSDIDVKEIEESIAKMERVKGQVTAFEEAWGFPVPVTPNNKITDSGERAKDFTNRLDIFMQSVSEQTSWGGVPMKFMDEAERIKRVKAQGASNVHGVFKQALLDAQAGVVGTERVAAGIPKRSGRGATTDTARDIKTLMDIQAGETGKPQLMTGSRFDTIRRGLMDGPGSEVGKSYSEKFMNEVESIFKDEDGNSRSEAAINEQLRQIREVADFRSKNGKDVDLPDDMKDYRSSDYASDIDDFVTKSRKSVGLGSEKIDKADMSRIEGELAKLWTPFQKRDDEVVGVINALQDAGEAGSKEAFDVAERLKKHKDESTRILSKITSDIGAGLRPAQADLDSFYREMDEMEALKLKTKTDTDLLNGTRVTKRKAMPKAAIEGRVQDVDREKDLADMKTRYATEFSDRYDDEVDKLMQSTLSKEDVDEIDAIAKQQLEAARKRGEKITKAKREEVRQAAEKLYRTSKLPVAWEETVTQSDKDGNVVSERTIQHALDKATVERVRREAGAAAVSRKPLRSKGAKLPSTASGVAARQSTNINGALKAAGIDPASTLERGMPELDSKYKTVSVDEMMRKAYLDVMMNSEVPETPKMPSDKDFKAMTPRQRARSIADYKVKMSSFDSVKAELESKAGAAASAVSGGDLTKQWLDKAISSGDVAAYARANGMPEGIKEALAGALYGGMNQGGVGGRNAGSDENGREGYAGLLKKRFGEVGKDGKRTNSYDFEDDALFVVNALAADAVEGDETAGRDAYRFKKNASQARRRAMGLAGRPGKYAANDIMPTESLVKSDDSAKQATKLNRVARRAKNDVVIEEKNVREARKALEEAKAVRDRIDKDYTDILDKGYTELSFKDDARQKTAKRAGYGSADEASAYVQDMRAGIAKNEKDIRAIEELKSLTARRSQMKSKLSGIDMTDGADADKKYGFIQEYEELLGYETDKNQPLEARMNTLASKMEDSYKRSFKAERKIAQRVKDSGVSKTASRDDVMQSLQDDIDAKERQLSGGNAEHTNKIGKTNNKIGGLEARQDRHMSGLRELEERQRAIAQNSMADSSAVDALMNEYNGKLGTAGKEGTKDPHGPGGVASDEDKRTLIKALEREIGEKADSSSSLDDQIAKLVKSSEGGINKRGLLDSISGEVESTRSTATSADRADLIRRLERSFGLSADTDMSLEDQIDNLIGRADQEVSRAGDQKAYRKLGGVIKRKKQAIERTNTALDDARRELVDLKAERSSFYSKEEAALLDFVDSEDEYQRERERVANIASQSDRKLTEQDDQISRLGGNLSKAEGRRDSSKSIVSRASSRLRRGTNVGTDESDLDVMKGALKPVKDGAGKFTKDADLTNLVGGLSPESAGAIHEMIVRQTSGSIEGVDGAVKTSLKDAKKIIAAHMPDLSDEMNTAYAEQALLVSREFGKNMQQAEQIFGKMLVNGKAIGITEQRAKMAAATGKVQAGLDPNTVSTLGTTRFGLEDSLSRSRRTTSGPDYMLDANNFDALMEDPGDDMDGSGALPSSGVNSAVEQRMLDELITGQFGDATDKEGVAEKILEARRSEAKRQRREKIESLEAILGLPGFDPERDESVQAELDRLINTPLDVDNQSIPKEVVKKIVDDAEVDVLTTQARIDEIETALDDANWEKKFARSSMSREQRDEAKREKKRLGKELAKLKAEQREHLNAIDEAMETRVSVTKKTTDDDGNEVESKPVLYKSHQEYIDARLAAAARAHASVEELADATEEEQDAFKRELEKEYDTLQEIEDLRVRNVNEQIRVDKQAAYDAAKADARKFNMRKRGRALITGNKAQRMDEDDVDTLTQMHLADKRDGKEPTSYDRSDVVNYRTNRNNQGVFFDRYQEDIYGPQLPPEMYAERRAAAVESAGTGGAEKRGWLARLRHGRGSELVPDAGAEPKERKTFKGTAKKVLGKTGDLVTGKAENLTGGILDKARWLSPLKPINMLASGTNKVGKGLAGIASKGILMSPLNAMFPEMAAGMASTVSAMGPLLPVLLVIVAIIAVLAVTWKHWSKYAKKGFDDLKESGKKLWKTVLDPIKGLFIKVFGQGKKGSDGMKTGWKSLGETIGKVASFIADMIKRILPVIKFIIEAVMTNIYIFIEFFKGVFALFTGDWEAVGSAIQNIWTAVMNYVKQIAAVAFQGIIEGLAFVVKGIVNGLGKIVNLEVFGKKLPGATAMKETLDSWNGSIDGMTDKTADFFDSWSNEVDWTDIGAADKGKDKKKGKDKRDAIEEGLNDGGAIEAPDMDTGKMDEAISKTSELMSAFRSRMANIVQGWKDAAMKAFETWETGQIDAVQAKIDAIDKEVAAEQKRDEDIAYLRAKEEIREKRRADMIRYQGDRSLAIYEGRYDDAKQLDYDNQQNLDASKREEEELERDREKTLTQRVRDAKKERIEIAKQELVETLALKKEQLQKQLDLMTEYIPKNVAEAERMHGAILGTMMKFTNGYGSIGKAQAEQWGMGWSDAMSQAKADVAFEAYWAGDAAMKYFAAALGVDITASDAAAPEGAGSDKGTDNPGYWQAYPEEKKKKAPTGTVGDYSAFHTGGQVGPKYSNAHDIPATLQSGEYVIKRDAVNKLGVRYLDSVNSGAPEELPTFHTGGFVGNVAKQARTLAGNAMKGQFHKAMDKWTTGKSKMKLGAGSYSAENYKAAMQAAAGPIMDYAGGTPVDGGGGYKGGEYATGINSQLLDRFTKWNTEMGGRFSIGSSFRTMAEQAYLYDRWIRKVPGQAQAAPPGSSNHNFGLAIDLKPSSTNASQRAAGAKYGLRWPMAHEPWHVEPVEARQWREAMRAGKTIASTTATGAAGEGSGGLILKGGKFGGGSAITGSGNPIEAGPMARILKTIRTLESGGNYRAESPYSTASGAYQFLKGTWSGYGGYPTAGSAPPNIQDARAASDVRSFLNQYNNDLRAVPGNWYSPATFRSGKWDEPMGNGNPMTMRGYIDKWLGTYSNIKMHKGGMVFPSMDVGGYVNSDGIAQVHAGETVLTKQITDALMTTGSVGGTTEMHLHFEGGFFGSDRELAKLQDKMERDIIPKMNRAKGLGSNTFSGATR